MRPLVCFLFKAVCFFGIACRIYKHAALCLSSSRNFLRLANSSLARALSLCRACHTPYLKFYIKMLYYSEFVLLRFVFPHFTIPWQSQRQEFLLRFSMPWEMIQRNYYLQAYFSYIFVCCFFFCKCEQIYARGNQMYSLRWFSMRQRASWNESMV